MERLVSVIILNYNHYKHTINCLKSLNRQTYSNFEVILIDNGSSKELFIKLRHEISKCKFNFKMKILRLKRNLYFGAGSNKGIKISKGEYLCLLNYDAIAEADFLEKMVEFLQNHPDAGMITPKIKYYADKRILWNTGSFINYKGIWVVENRGFLEFDPNDQKYTKVEEIDYAPGTALFLRKEVINQIGLIDEIFLMYHEDPDWNLRAKKYGYKSYYVPTTKVYHNIPLDKKERRSYFNYFFLKRNTQIFVWKHASFINLLIFYYIFFFMNIYDILLYVFHRRKDIIFIQFNSIIRGFRIGLNRRTNRSCKKYLLEDYFYSRKIQQQFK